MCIYIHPCLFLRKQREVTGVVHIGVGFLRCSFPIVGIAKALKHGTDEGEIPTPLLYILAGITIIRSSNGNPGDAHLQNDMIHAGQLIERTLHEQGRTVTWFAGQLCCTRPNIYKIFKKENIDIHLLWRISCILDHDFFRDLSDNIRIGTSSCVSK